MIPGAHIGRLFACIVTLALSACATPWSKSVVALPNGYYLRARQAGDIWIVKGDAHSAAVGPIAAYSVLNSVVAGALGEVPEVYRTHSNDLEFKGTTTTRYFLLDTASGKLESDLDEAAWQARVAPLSRLGPVRLYAPLPLND
jgi:hypothetical protein